MHACEGCRDRLLDYLYDLLDEAEGQQLRDHLEGCPACQAEMTKARAQQRLLAAAVRAHFPNVIFSPPTVEHVATEEAPVLPLKPQVKKSVRWSRWAVAAAILLAVVGIGIPVGLAARDYSDAAHVVLLKESELSDAREAIVRAVGEMRQAANQRDRRIEQVRQEARGRELRMEVQGPQTIQAGAPSVFTVRTYDLNNRPAAAEVSASLDQPGAKSHEELSATGAQAHDRNKDKDTKAEKKVAAQGPDVRELRPGEYQIVVPASMNVDPGRVVAMNVSARRKDDPRLLSLQGSVRLNAPVYLTHLATDKPMYQPGETLRFRSLTLERSTLRPADADFRVVYTLTAPDGSVRASLRGANAVVRENGKDALNGPDGKPLRGIGVGEFSLENAKGGEYTLSVSEEYGRFPATTRKFTVNEYQKPRLDKKLDFNKPTYGPGDDVLAVVSAKRADGGPVKDRPVEITVNVDGKLIGSDGNEVGKSFHNRTDGEGVVLVRFKLPTRIDRGLASLSVAFHDGHVEPIVRPIPIVLNKVAVEFFPEGGDLIAGLPNRVYFQARTPLGKPAQVSATLLEGERVIASNIETLADDQQPGVNQGNGAFSFIPEAAKQYTFRIDSPRGITQPLELPKARADGVVLTVSRGVFEANEDIPVVVHSTKPRTLLVGAYCRGNLLQTVRLEKGQTQALLNPGTGAGGVCRITVFEELPGGGQQRDLLPMAERLVYRHPKERVDLAMTTDKRGYTPGQKVNLSLIAVNEQEKMAPSIAMLAVVDKSVVTLADQKTDRSMTTHLLLTTEVRRAEDLEYADFLVGQHPKAPRALDLLLGTQGWRRFAEQSPAQWRQELAKQARNLADPERARRAEDADRLLVLTGQSQPKTIDFDQEQIDRAIAEFNEQAIDLQANHDNAANNLATATQDESYLVAQERMAVYRSRLMTMRDVGLLAMLLAFVALLVVAATQATQRAIQLGVAALFVGLGGLVVMAIWGMPDFVTKVPMRQATADREVPQLAAPAVGNVQVWDAKEQEQFDAFGPMPMENAVAAQEKIAEKADDAANRRTKAEKEGFHFEGGKGDAGKLLAKGAAPARGGEGRAKLMAKKDLALPLQPNAPPMGQPAREMPRPEPMVAPGAGGFGGQAPPAGFFRDRRDMAPQGAPVPQDQFFGGRGGGAPGPGGPPVLLPLAPLVVREYAHNYVQPTDGVRRDFAETLYWHPALILPDGKLDVSFSLCDSVTTFEATAFVHTTDGRLGVATKKIESRLPFTLAPKVPIEVTATDRIDLPLSIGNNTGDAQEVAIELLGHEGLALLNREKTRKLSLNPEQRGRQLFSLRPALVEGKATVRFAGKTGTHSDSIEESIRVVPDGFPVTGSASDLLEGSVTHKVKLPTWLDGTLAVRVDVYPSTLADLQKGLEGLLREPHGCFEQSSTTNYPNVLILDYLKTTDKADPQTERKTRELLQRGYQRLISFECRSDNKRQGYEWFGGTAPPHEALTAYGLLQFTDMAKRSEVDAGMLKRTKEYLLAQRDGNGGFKRNTRALDTFGRAPDHITNAYIVWALTEADGDTDLTKELAALQTKAKASVDPYFVSLVALSLRNRNQSDVAKTLLSAIAKKQQDDGHLDATETSITGSGGQSLQIETTALAVLAWLKTDEVTFGENIRKAVKWIGQQRGGHGAFGSTQSTILALKALIAHAQANKRVPEAGELRLYVGNTKVAKLSFPAGVDKPLSLALPEPEEYLNPGENKLRVEITGAKNVFPHTMSWTYRTAKPESAARTPVKLTTTLAKTDLNEGDSVRLKVRVENTTSRGQSMAVAIVGLPAGLSLPEDQKQLKDFIRLPDDGGRPLVSAYEVIGREVVLYWRDLAKDQVIEVPLDLVARVPGEYRGPASRSYLYYDAEGKDWVEPLAVKVQAR